MKRLLLIVLPLLLIVGCSKPISEETLIDKDGLKYHPDTKELYSGEVFKNRMGGKKEFEGSYKDGDSTGIWSHWYENGQKDSEITYKDGKKDGLLTYWYESGQKQSEGTLKNEKFDGLWTWWYENGQMKQQVTFKDGKSDGLYTFWYENGQKSEVRTYKDGKLISKKEWNEDGSVKE